MGSAKYTKLRQKLPAHFGAEWTVFYPAYPSLDPKRRMLTQTASYNRSFLSAQKFLMAKTNPTLRLISRVLNRADSMVYFVNDQEELVFANQRLADWLGVPLESLNEVRLAFQSAGPHRRLDCLCPPPDLWEAGAGSKTFWVVRSGAAVRDTQGNQPTSTDQSDASTAGSRNIEYYLAHAVRIDSEKVASGVLVVIDLNSLWVGRQGESPVGLATDLATELHLSLSRLANEASNSFSIESLVGDSPFASRIRRQVQIAADSEADVLIHGPLGCGKEHLARAIYARTEGDEAGLAPVHCPIADPELIQQRIFDARSSLSLDRRDGESPLVLLLLDVDQLSHDAQAELLGFLELPDFRIRTLATSSQPLLELADNDSFSKRLAHRLGSLAIEMVSLKDRAEDIPLLAQSVLEKDNVRRRRQLAGFSDDALEMLMEFGWPENMNQLTRVIEAAAAKCQGRIVTAEDLPDEFHFSLQAQRIGGPVEVSIDLDAYLGEIEKKLITRAMHQTGGNKTQAAKQLNISRPKLLRRLQTLGLDEFLQSSPTTERDETEPLDASAFEELKE